MPLSSPGTYVRVSPGSESCIPYNGREPLYRMPDSPVRVIPRSALVAQSYVALSAVIGGSLKSGLPSRQSKYTFALGSDRAFRFSEGALLVWRPTVGHSSGTKCRRSLLTPSVGVRSPV